MSSVEVVRGGVVESRHTVSVVVADGRGDSVVTLGDPGALTFYRSAAKPLQALPLVEEDVTGRFGLTASELALCCASHEGEQKHVRGARSILSKCGADESLLRCGAHRPFSLESSDALVRAREEPGRIHNNCSGKHAGMIAFAIAMEWDPVDYHLPDHPVQQRMLGEIERWSGRPSADIPVAVDGCGVSCFAVGLDEMAASFGRFTAEAVHGGASAQVIEAMTEYPFMVGGTGRTCSDVMSIASGRAWVKLGAEGVYGGGVRGSGLGFAIKVADGGRRAVEAALIRTLECLGVLDADDVEAVARHGRPQVLNTRNEVVGEIRPAFDFTLPSAVRI